VLCEYKFVSAIVIDGIYDDNSLSVRQRFLFLWPLLCILTNKATEELDFENFGSLVV
jgi:hypothetical protein